MPVGKAGPLLWVEPAQRGKDRSPQVVAYLQPSRMGAMVASSGFRHSYLLVLSRLGRIRSGRRPCKAGWKWDQVGMGWENKLGGNRRASVLHGWRRVLIMPFRFA